jgi:RNA polymerase sigma-70 factor (ECF subfamily)
MEDCAVIGDEKARWEAAYREEAPRLWRALLLASGSPDVASDVMAEAFAQGIARGDQVRIPGAWVWRAAFAIAGGELQRMKRPVEPLSAPEILAPESLMDLTRALRGLPPRQRVVTILHYYGGYSLREIASIVGSSRSSVGVHLYRARKALRDELEADDG